MGVQIGLCILVSDGNDIVIHNLNAIQHHDIVAQSFLKFGAHEIISGPTSVQDREVNLEPEEVEEEGDGNQSEGSCCKMRGKLLHRKSPLVVEHIP